MKGEHQQFIHPLYGRLCGHLLPQFKPRFKDWRTISRLPETWLVNQYYIPLGSPLIFKFRHLEAATKEGTVINTGVQPNYVWEINHFKRTENKLSDQYWINVSTECSCLEKKNETFLDDLSLKLIHRQGVKIASNNYRLWMMPRHIKYSAFSMDDLQTASFVTPDIISRLFYCLQFKLKVFNISLFQLVRKRLRIQMKISK